MKKDTGIDKWDGRFLDLAVFVGDWSKDPSTKVGAVLVRPDRTIAGLGFNGFPRGVLDHPERYDDRPTKYEMVVHAEMNALLSSRESLEG
jgi:dCMP deaminase